MKISGGDLSGLDTLENESDIIQYPTVILISPDFVHKSRVSFEECKSLKITVVTTVDRKHAKLLKISLIHCVVLAISTLVKEMHGFAKMGNYFTDFTY